MLYYRIVVSGHRRSLDAVILKVVTHPTPGEPSTVPYLPTYNATIIDACEVPLESLERHPSGDYRNLGISWCSAPLIYICIILSDLFLGLEEFFGTYHTVYAFAHSYLSIP